MAGDNGRELYEAAPRLELQDVFAHSVARSLGLAFIAACHKGDGSWARAYADSPRAPAEPQVRAQPDDYRWHLQLGRAYAALGRPGRHAP